MPTWSSPTRRGSSPTSIGGAATGPSTQGRLELPTLHAAAAAFRDFNGDGWVDLAFANEQDGRTYDVNSYIYWNGPEGFDSAHRLELQGFGAVSLQADDLNLDGHADLVLVNRNSGSETSIPSLIYWGNPNHHYSQAALSTLPFSMSAPAIADLDQDGWVDVAFPTGRIYWGGHQGYSQGHSQDLSVPSGYGAATADLNRDGYLDLVIAAGTAYGEPKPKGIILWGSRAGYDWSRRSELKLNTLISQSPTIADLNKDGVLDLVFCDVDGPRVEIFWGTAQGAFSRDHHSSFQVQPSSTVEVADLNADGWLDMIVGGGWDSEQFGRPTRHISILWGSREGYSEERMLRLEGYDPLEHAVADLNKGRVPGHRHQQLSRLLHPQHPRLHLLGLPGGKLQRVPPQPPARRVLGSPHGGRPQPGRLVRHRGLQPPGPGRPRRRRLHLLGRPPGLSPPTAATGSRPSAPTSAPARTSGTSTTASSGNPIVRPPFNCRRAKQASRLRWEGSTPHGTGVRLQVRSAPSETALEDAAWTGPGGAGGHFKDSGAALNLPATHRWLQYRATLTTPNGGSTPVLEAVHIDVSEAGE